MVYFYLKHEYDKEMIDAQNMGNLLSSSDSSRHGGAQSMWNIFEGLK